MKTKADIENKIKEIRDDKYSYELQGGGWVPNPYPYDHIIELLEWVLDKNKK